MAPCLLIKQILQSNMKNDLKNNKTSRGATEIIVAAIVLPIVLLLLAATIDLSRLPIAGSRLEDSLAAGAYSVETRYSEDSSTTMLEPSFPAVQNICNYTAAVGSCDISAIASNQGLLTNNLAQALVDKACALGSEQYDLGAKSTSATTAGGFTGLIRAQVTWAMQYALYTIDAGGPVAIATSADTCSGNSFTTFSGAGAFTASTAATALSNAFATRRSSDANAGLWVIPDGCGTSWSSCTMVTGTQRLSPVWLIGVGYAKVKPFIGKGYFGEERVLVDYIIRPLSAPVGIQTGV